MRIVFGLALMGAACALACGSSSKSSPGAGGSTVSGGGESGSGSSGAHHGGANSTGGDGNGGEAGMVEPTVISTAKPHAAGGLVSGGVVAHSSHFTGVFSLGAAPGSNGVLTSKSTQLRGGVVGASQQ